MVDETPKSDAPPAVRRRERSGVVGGMVLVVLGCLLLVERFVPEVRLEDYWPLILVALGVGLLLKRRPS